MLKDGTVCLPCFEGGGHWSRTVSVQVIRASGSSSFVQNDRGYARLLEASPAGIDSFACGSPRVYA